MLDTREEHINSLVSLRKEQPNSLGLRYRYTLGCFVHQSVYEMVGELVNGVVDC